jgi:arylsulfatase A-like enzyme
LIGKPLSYEGEFFPMYRSLIHIPLIVRPPRGIEGGRRIRGIVQPPDTLPTILDHFGVGPPADSHGRSWKPALDGEQWAGRPYAVSAQRRILATVTDDRWLYCCWQGQRRAALFNVQDDPLQERDVFGTESAVAEKCHGELVSCLHEIGADDQAGKYRPETTRQQRPPT